MRISKKILAVILAVLMAFSMMPFTAFASESTTTWDISSVPDTVLDYNSSCTVDDVTITSSGAATIYGMLAEKDICAYDANGGQLTFSTDAGNFTKIKIDVQEVYYGTMDDPNWVLENGACVWTGNSNEVVFNLSANLDIVSTFIEFTIEEPAPAVPQATVTEIAAPEGAAFAYKFEAPADKPTAYDAYHADFVATFDRDIKAGEVTLYGNYADYGWVALTINEDIPAGTEYRIYQNLMNDTLTYATVRDEVSPFLCGAGGAVLNEANMTVQLKLYPVEGGVEGTPVNASDAVTDTLEAVPQATVTEVAAPEGAAFAYKFEADSAKPTAYDAYHADFVATFDRDIKAGEVTLYGNYADYGWVALTINEDIPAGTPYRIYQNLMNDTLTYATVRDEVSPFLCGAGGAVLADTNMTVNFVLYPVAGGVEGAPVNASEEVTGEIEKVEAQDEYSIVIKDRIDLDIFVAPENVTHLKVIANTDPDKQQSTIPADAEKQPVSAFEVKDGHYVVTVPLAPAQIRDTITVVVYNGDTVLRTITTSIADYCEAIVNENAYTGAAAAEVKALAQATLNYGKAASDYFGYNTAAFAGDSVGDACNFDGYTLKANATNVGISSVHYVATSVPSVRFVLDGMDAETAATLTATCGAYETTIGTLDGIVAVEVKGIPVSKLGETLTVSFSNGAKIEYTPLAFAKVAARDGDTAAMKNLGNALGNYYAATMAVANAGLFE